MEQSLQVIRNETATESNSQHQQSQQKINLLLKVFYISFDSHDHSIHIAERILVLFIASNCAFIFKKDYLNDL